MVSRTMLMRYHTHPSSENYLESRTAIATLMKWECTCEKACLDVSRSQIIQGRRGNSRYRLTELEEDLTDQNSKT